MANLSVLDRDKSVVLHGTTAGLFQAIVLGSVRRKELSSLKQSKNNGKNLCKNTLLKGEMLVDNLGLRYARLLGFAELLSCITIYDLPEMNCATESKIAT